MADAEEARKWLAVFVLYICVLSRLARPRQKLWAAGVCRAMRGGGPRGLLLPLLRATKEGPEEQRRRHRLAEN